MQYPVLIIENDAYVPTATAAALAGVTVARIGHMRATGQLRGVTVAGGRWICRADITALLEWRGANPAYRRGGRYAFPGARAGI